MTTKLVRLTNTAEDILRVYSGKDSLSRGVIMMQGILFEKDREIARLKEVADDLQKKALLATSGHDEKYWERMRSLFHERLTGSNGYQQASKLVVTEGKVVTPVKTYGKIDEGEKLQEPVGRQGRDVR